MSSLGLTLLILIVVAIGGLAAFNYWTQRRERPGGLLDDDAAPPEPGERTEPSLGSADASGARNAPDMPADWMTDKPQSTSAEPVPDYTWAPEVPGAVTDQPSEPGLKMPSWAAGDDAAPAPGDSPEAPPFDVAPAQASAPQDMKEWLDKARRDLSADAAAEPTSTDATPDDDASVAAGMPAAARGSGPVSDEEIDAKLDFEIGDEGPGSQSHDTSRDDEGVEDASSAVAPVDGEIDAQAPAADSAEEPGGTRPEPEVSAVAGDAPDDGAADPAEVANNFFTTVNLDLPELVAGHTLLRVTDGFTAAGTKPVWISAGERIDSGSVRTALIEPSKNYSLLRFDLLQVNRHGPLNGVEYSEFVRRVNDIAEELGALANTPDMNIVLIRSRVVDAEVASLDAQVAVNVEAEDPISLDRFNDCAAQLRLRPTADGSYLNVDPSGAVLNTVSLDTEANRIVLVLDVPTVPARLEPIRKMVECAWKFAQAVEGQMIDDNGRIINNALFERIESQIGTHYEALQAAGLTAGAELTRQVYNSDHDVAPPPPPAGSA